MCPSSIKFRMSEQRSPFLYLGVGLIVIIGGYLVWYNFLQPSPVGDIGFSKGNILLDQEIAGVDGTSVKLSDYRGSILVIDFMAPWCNPCKAQIPILQQIESIPGVEMISINIDPNYNMTFLQDFAEEEGITWYMGHSPLTALEYEINAIPVIMIVKPDGEIHYRAFFTTIQEFDRVLSPLLV